MNKNFKTIWKEGSPYNKVSSGDNITEVYSVRSANGMPPMIFNTKAEAEEYSSRLLLDGVFSTVVHEKVVKATVEKGAKFERCVAHVKDSNPGANAYAVCNAVMSEKSFEKYDADQMCDIIDKALAGMGIVAGGPIPHSLLARQDLEPTTKSLLEKGRVSIHVTYVDELGNKQVRCFGTSSDYDQFLRNEGRGVKILAEDIKEKSMEDSHGEYETEINTHKSLIERIRRNQKVSVAKGSTFKDLWSKIRATNKGTINK